ncbi:transcriptional regulator [Pseudomaricurvus alkylphenolicus]|jgi:sigma-E factor negative regulatory protein RseC|uniref:SoxR reducing system RseC family protein n=1 Tax=Pseudomaricurvus alkylphenolicus TaxID=1306991 RepID=UPI00141E1860|nr:SoxR reducing system RseC family protein [Pseudomaricurvus alkylphenolicus]NIB43313.1 transcriptional regulator [Pseudomaricurvus alkylphenolicus]
MITESGRIVAIENDCLWVETIQRSTCESCAAEKGCGQSLVSKWGGRTSFIRVLLQGRDCSHYALHDEVTVGIPEDVVAAGSILVYLTPLLTLLLGAGCGHWLGLAEPGVIFLAVLGLALGGGLVRWHSFVHRDDERMQPVLLDGTEAVRWQS